MVYLLLSINLVLIYLVFRLSLRSINGQFSGSGVHPLSLFCLLCLVFNVDFFLLYQTPSATSLLYEFYFKTTKSDVLKGYIVYTYLFACGCCGVWVAYLRKTARLSHEGTYGFVTNAKLKRRVASLMLVAVVACSVYGSTILNSISDSGAARQAVFSENMWTIIPFLFLIPAIVIFLANHLSDTLIPMLSVAVCLFLLATTGTRGHIIFMGFVSLIFVQIRGYQIRKSILVLLIPILVLYLVADRYLKRYSGDASDIQEFVSQSEGLVQLLFFTGEISMAEVITTITMEINSLERYPFESFIGFLMIPVPRSLLPFKPFGSSAVFTDYVAPMRRFVSGSEIATTGYGDLIMQFGIISSGLVFFILCYVWCRLFISVLNKQAYYVMLFLPFLVWWPYLFLRSGVFDVGVKFWYAFILYGVYRFSVDICANVARRQRG